MSTFEMIISILLMVLLLAVVWMLTELTAIKKSIEEHRGADPDTQKIRLQAYERVTLLAERMSLQSMISATPNAGLSVKQMQHSLISTIKQEYEYNLSQQIYVSIDIWKAVNNLKEQNIYIVNQLAGTLPSQASAMDLNKQIIDFLINNPRASLHSLVLEAISYEAKKLM